MRCYDWCGTGSYGFILFHIDSLRKKADCRVDPISFLVRDHLHCIPFVWAVHEKFPFCKSLTPWIPLDYPITYPLTSSSLSVPIPQTSPNYFLIEGSLEVKLPTIWTDEKQSREEAERRERLEERRVRRKKMQMHEKVGKSWNTVFFQWCGAPEGRKVGSLKRQVRSQLARWEMKNCTQAHFQVKMYKTQQLRTTFTSWYVEKVHAVVARSTFRSQNVQNTPAPDHFCQLRCRKSARRCGAKHISKSKCTKHTMVGPLLGRWDVEKVHAVVARSTFRSQNVQNTPWSDHFWKVRCRKSARRCGAKHISKSKCFKHYRGSDHFWRFRCRFASLHYTTFHYITLQDITLHSSTLQYTTLHSGTLHYTKLHYTTLHYTEWHCTTDRQVDRQTDR